MLPSDLRSRAPERASTEGKSLPDLLQREQLTLEEILTVMVRAMDRVAAAHALGVLHRKLKPSNIRVRMSMSGRFDDPRVLDLNEATDAGASEALHYLPLEQLEGDAELDARVDVYAMGVILYEAIGGRLPHHAESAAELALELKHMPAVELGMRRLDLPDGLSEVVMRAIASERADRYPTMRAFIEALLPFVPDGAGLAVRELPVRPPLARASEDAHRLAQRAQVSHDDLTRAPSSTRLSAPRLPTELMPAAPPSEAHGSLAPHRTPLRARVLGALGALSVTAAALAGARLISWSHTENKGASSAPDAAHATAAQRAAGVQAGVRLAASDAGQIDVTPAQAAQPHATITVTSWITVVDGGWPPAERETSAPGDDVLPAAATQQ